MNKLWTSILTVVLNGCAITNSVLEEPLECTGFTLVGTYWAYDIRANHLVQNSRLLTQEKAILTSARKAAAPFAQPTAIAAVSLREYLHAPYTNQVQRIVLRQNMEFWIHHFTPHVEVLINAVNGVSMP